MNISSVTVGGFFRPRIIGPFDGYEMTFSLKKKLILMSIFTKRPLHNYAKIF